MGQDRENEIYLSDSIWPTISLSFFQAWSQRSCATLCIAISQSHVRKRTEVHQVYYSFYQANRAYV